MNKKELIERYNTLRDIGHTEQTNKEMMSISNKLDAILIKAKI